MRNKILGQICQTMWHVGNHPSCHAQPQQLPMAEITEWSLDPFALILSILQEPAIISVTHHRHYSLLKLAHIFQACCMLSIYLLKAAILFSYLEEKYKSYSSTLFYSFSRRPLAGNLLSSHYILMLLASSKAQKKFM